MLADYSLNMTRDAPEVDNKWKTKTTNPPTRPIV